jgi:hypothetical protein
VHSHQSVRGKHLVGTTRECARPTDTPARVPHFFVQMRIIRRSKGPGNRPSLLHNCWSDDLDMQPPGWVYESLVAVRFPSNSSKVYESASAEYASVSKESRASADELRPGEPALAP